MIPYEELVAALANWRARQGLPPLHGYDFLGAPQQHRIDTSSAIGDDAAMEATNIIDLDDAGAQIDAAMAFDDAQDEPLSWDEQPQGSEAQGLESQGLESQDLGSQDFAEYSEQPYGDQQAPGDQQAYAQPQAYDPQQPYGDQQAYEQPQAYDPQQPYGDQQAYGQPQAYDPQQPYGDQQAYAQPQAYDPQQPYGDQQAYEQPAAQQGQYPYDSGPAQQYDPSQYSDPNAQHPDAGSLPPDEPTRMTYAIQPADAQASEYSAPDQAYPPGPPAMDVEDKREQPTVIGGMLAPGGQQPGQFAGDAASAPGPQPGGYDATGGVPSEPVYDSLAAAAEYQAEQNYDADGHGVGDVPTQAHIPLAPGSDYDQPYDPGAFSADNAEQTYVPPEMMQQGAASSEPPPLEPPPGESDEDFVINFESDEDKPA